MLIFILILCFTLIFTLTYSILFLFNSDKVVLQNRLNEIKDDLMENIESKSFLERAIYPLYNFLINFFVRFTPKNKIKNLTAKLERAGYSKNLEKWIFTKSVSMIIVFLSSYMLFDFISQNTLKSMLLSIILVMLTSYMFNFNLARRIEIRKRNILKNLPYTLDLITVSVEAGLSFDGAIAKVIENIQGDLSDEFAKTLKEMKMGIPRKIALKNLSERCGVRELSMLVTSLIQADELGVSLGKVLRIESANIREHRKQMARENALKAPIKMLFPLMFFIFPTIFVIILGPAVIRIYNFFLR